MSCPPFITSLSIGFGVRCSHQVPLGHEKVLLLVHKLSVESLEQRAGELLADGHLDVVLLSGPEMLDELAVTS